MLLPLINGVNNKRYLIVIGPIIFCAEAILIVICFTLPERDK